MSAAIPQTAMVLAAGLGTRMRPITDSLPKPLVEIAGKTMLDYCLDGLGDAGVTKAVVNVHHFADRIIAHVASRGSPHVVISDETGLLRDSAGGIVKALPELGDAPFFVRNADSFWIDGPESELSRLALAWDAAKMDILLMLADPHDSTGHSGRTDFLVDSHGRLSRAEGSPEGLIYAGAAIIHPRIFADADAQPHSLNRYFDAAIAAGRLFGSRMQEHWITVGTPSAIAEAERALERCSARTDDR